MQSSDQVGKRLHLANRRLVALLIFIMLLGAQFGWSLFSEREPYPVIKMPSFSLPAETAGTVPSRSRQTTISYEDGTIITPTVGELMGEDFRYSAVSPSYDYAFRPENNLDGKGALSDPEIVSWLSSRAEILNGTSDVVSIDFCWVESKIDITTGQSVSAMPCELSRVEF